MCVCVCVCVCVSIQQGEQLGNILGGKILLLVRKNFFVIDKNTLLGEEGNLGKRSNTIYLIIAVVLNQKLFCPLPAGGIW